MKIRKQAKRVTNKLLKELDGPQMKGTIKKVDSTDKKYKRNTYIFVLFPFYLLQTRSI